MDSPESINLSESLERLERTENSFVCCLLFVVCCSESAHNTLQMPSLYADGLQEMANNALARKLIRHMNKKLNVLLNTHKEPEIFILKDPNKQALSCNVFEDIDSLCSFISPCFISVNTQYVREALT